MSKSKLPSITGQASAFLKHATGDYNELKIYISGQIEGLKFARAFLKVNS
jgi:isopentenyl-diphosphate delta-isomerase